MYNDTQERLDEVAGRIGSLARSLARLDEGKSYSLFSNRRMKRVAVRMAILTTGYVMLQSEVLKENATKAAA